MKKPIVKLASITAFALLLSLTSCKESTTVVEGTENTKEPVVQLRVTTPQPSPLGKVEQKVGMTDVTIEYSRPGVKGRKIFGGLEKYGKIWRTGANANTKITFSSDVVVDGQTLKAGSYGIYSIPNKDKWEVMFYSESDKRGVPSDWDDSKVAARTTVEVYPMSMNIETFTITLDDLTNNSAVIGLLWEKTYIGIKFEVPTDAIVLANIDATLAATPKATDYYNAAIYYSKQGKDIKKASEWMEKGISMMEKPRFFQLREQSLIYAKAGDKEKAIATAKKSLELSKEAKNDAYIKMNTESLKEWGA
tara:strand:+ start:33032 stop:33949 length:918 start_codon:yes stop_codon:yes gene_type:complete